MLTGMNEPLPCKKQMAKQYYTILGEPWVFKQALPPCLVVTEKVECHFSLPWGACQFIKITLR